MDFERMPIPQKIIGWGTSTAFEDYYQASIPHAYLIDNNAQKQGTVIQGMTVFAPEQLLLEDPDQVLIIVYSCFWSEISKQIAKMGPYKVIYCRALPAFRLHFNEQDCKGLLNQYSQFKKAILIPCHTPKIKYLEQFFQTIKEAPSFKIIIMTTTHEEEKVFRETFQKIKYVDFFSLVDCTSILSPKLIHDLITHGHPSDEGAKKLYVRLNSIINIKKLVGLRKLFEDGYHYLMCIDCDLVAGSLSLDTAMEQSFINYHKRCYFGAPFEETWTLCRPIVLHNLALFAKEDILALMSCTKNAMVFSWFYDPPTYQYNDFNDFNQFMIETHGSYENFVTSLTGLSFDHILFFWFLILKNRATMLDYSDIGVTHLAEALTLEDHEKIKSNYDYTPLWITYELYMALPEKKRLELLSIYPLIYHVDRGKHGVSIETPQINK